MYSIYISPPQPCEASQVVLVVKNPPANAGDLRDEGLIPGWGRSPGGGNGNPLQYLCLENPTVRGAWHATVHGVTKSWTRLKQLSISPPCKDSSQSSKWKNPRKWREHKKQRQLRVTQKQQRKLGRSPGTRQHQHLDDPLAQDTGQVPALWVQSHSWVSQWIRVTYL